jgi:3',5'-cyclic AMP phosphodiesterase CpdA
VPSYSSGALHHVVVGLGEEGPLAALATYFYRVGDPEMGWSAEFNFTMPREAHQDGGFPYRLGLVGDLGQTENSAQTLEHLMANRPDSVLNVGDLSYADGEQQRWDTYGRLVQPSTAAVPHMTIEGNHELESIDGGPLDFLAYESRWRMPFERSGSSSALYYSYETGPAHVIMLGSYAPYGKGSKQMAWLKRDLAAVDRGRTPWLVVGMHAPWYNSNAAHQLEVDDMRRVMEPLLFSYGVDLVFAGHVHAYERSVRVFDNQPSDCGPVHIVIGDGGNREGLALDYLKQPEWSAMREASYGHGTLDFESPTSAVFRWHRNQDGAAVTADETSIKRRLQCVGWQTGPVDSNTATQRRRRRHLLGDI